jgi:hypothetical protein
MQNDGSATEYAKKLTSLYTHDKQMEIALSGDWYDPVRALFHTTRSIEQEIILCCQTTVIPYLVKERQY